MGFYGSVIQAMFQKAAIPDDDFNLYLEVLLGNKDDKKVMELMSKAAKPMRNSRPKQRDSGRRCYSCGGYGHFHATCPFRRSYEWSPLLVVQIFPLQGELVAVRLTRVCPR